MLQLRPKKAIYKKTPHSDWLKIWFTSPTQCIQHNCTRKTSSKKQTHTHKKILSKRHLFWFWLYKCQQISGCAALWDWDTFILLQMSRTSKNQLILNTLLQGLWLWNRCVIGLTLSSNRKTSGSDCSPLRSLKTNFVLLAALISANCTASSCWAQKSLNQESQLILNVC